MDHMNYRFGPILRVPRRLRGRFRRSLKATYLESGELLDTLKTLRHPNLMSVYDYDDAYVYVEYIDGLVLSNRRPHCPTHHTQSYIDIAESIDLTPIRDAIGHLHVNGLCHTDVTSHNIMATRDGTLKLIDLVCCLPRKRAFLRRDFRMFAELEREIHALVPPEQRREVAQVGGPGSTAPMSAPMRT